MKHFIVTLLFATAITAYGQIPSDEEVKATAAAKISTKQIDSNGWLKGGFFSTNLSSTSFSNWAQGGTNNIAVVANTSLFAIYHHNKHTWEGYLDAAYGVIRNGTGRIDDPRTPDVNSREVRNPFIKNEDKLVLLTKYGRKIKNNFNYSSLLSLNTQMFPGYDPTDVFRDKPIVSNFMAQGFGYLSVGIDYKPTDYFSVYLSPVTAKYTAVLDQRLADLGSYGVRAAEYDTTGGKNIRTRKGQTFRSEFGWYLNVNLKKDIAKNMNLQTRLELFNNYQTLGIIDVNIQNTLNMKVNQYVGVSLISQLIYDNDIDTNPNEAGVQRRVQLKNFFGVGFSIKFGNKL